MADVRDVSCVILNGGRNPEDFEEYAQRRADRHAKQRVSAQTMAEMVCAFGAENDARRLRALPLLGSDELIGALVGVLFAGPDILPRGTDVLIAARERFLAA
jgi:hypothetical protein